MSRRRRIPLRPTLSAVAACATGAVCVTPAHAASTLVIEGRGFGHGVGMSQYGAYGYAQHGVGYRDILGHYYTGTTLGTLPSAPEVGVLLATGRGSVTVSQADRVGAVKLDPARAYTLSGDGTGGVVVRDDKHHKVAKAPGAVRVSAGGGAGAVKLHGTAGDGLTDAEYRGALAIRPEAVGGLSVVNAVGLEDYVRGVVGAESPSGWPAEALRAQAVAARTYAITTNAGGGAGSFTQYPDTRSQVYHGVAAETAATDAAVRATTRQVVTYKGAPIVTYFFSTSGGRTENVENGFPGAAPEPYLVSVKDPYDGVSPRHTWRVELTLAQAQAKLGGLVPGTLRRIVVLERGASPRVLRARIVGSRGSTEVDGATLRRRFGLDDSWARFSVLSTTATRRTVRGTTVRSVAVPAVPFLAPAQPLRFSGWATFGAVVRQGAQPTSGDEVLTAPAATTRRTVRRARVRVRTIAGRITGRRGRSSVRIQRGKGGGRWSTVAAVRTSARGFYSARVQQPGVYRIRTRGLIGPHVRMK
ncbi:MAG: SpoIID/LytB protein [Solirubrobacterales bacterium]|nr:SpoIID/LytB protein [Solirubrobacterales bacterium]